MELDIDAEGWDLLIYEHNAGLQQCRCYLSRGVIVGVELVSSLRTVEILL